MRTVLLAVAVLLVLAISPTPAHAATCNDFSNQAAAQRAANTRDPDGDGIYCENLPCPCSARQPAALAHGITPRRRSHAGAPRPRSPGSATRCSSTRGRRRAAAGYAARCPTRAARLAPIYPRATRRLICRTGYTALVRDVAESTKNAVYREYGIRHHRPGQYEVDHLVPLELGGSSSIANLFPQRRRPRPGFREKDQLENAAT